MRDHDDRVMALERQIELACDNLTKENRRAEQWRQRAEAAEARSFAAGLEAAAKVLDAMLAPEEMEPRMWRGFDLLEEAARRIRALAENTPG